MIISAENSPKLQSFAEKKKNRTCIFREKCYNKSTTMLQGVGAVRQVPMGWEVAHWAKVIGVRITAMLLPQPPEQDAPIFRA